MIASHGFWPSCIKSQLKLTFTQGHLITVMAPSYAVTEWSSHSFVQVLYEHKNELLAVALNYTFSSSRDVVRAAQQWDIVPGNIFIGTNKVTNSFVTKMSLK